MVKVETTTVSEKVTRTVSTVLTGKAQVEALKKTLDGVGLPSAFSTCLLNMLIKGEHIAAKGLKHPEPILFDF